MDVIADERDRSGVMTPPSADDDTVAGTNTCARAALEAPPTGATLVATGKMRPVEITPGQNGGHARAVLGSTKVAWRARRSPPPDSRVRALVLGLPVFATTKST